jgi:predicted RNA-binding Zn ribbon-like protein
MPRLLSGNVGLDFLNTVDPRGGQHPHEHLTSFDSLCAWAVHAGAIAQSERTRLLGVARSRPSEARTVHEHAIHAREALYGLFSASMEGCTPLASDLSLVSQENAALFTHAELRWQSDEFGWAWRSCDRLDQVLWRPLRAAVDLLTSADLLRVGVCDGEDGCGWLFLDTTKNHSRRWCDMRVCGNRAKARRHGERVRERSTMVARNT